MQKTPDPKEAFAEGKIISASAAFISIKGIADLGDGLEIYRLISALHKIIKSCLEDEGFEGIQALSALTGAILVVPDKLNVDCLKLLRTVSARTASEKIPIRIGVAQGELQALRDVDGKINFIGTCLNIAARLSTSEMNEGILAHESFAAGMQGLIGKDHWLSPLRQAVKIKGKRDETFNCYKPPAAASPDCSESEWPACLEIGLKSDEKIEQGRWVNAALISYDLPNFSDGDMLSLSQRFRAVADASQDLNLGRKGFYLLPGGDGGILALSGISKDQAHSIAEEFAKSLEIESINKDSSIWVKCRIGVHYGTVPLYENAGGALRPTGIEPFIADKIIGDDEARKKADDKVMLIITGEFREAVGKGSDQWFDDRYEPLPALAAYGRIIARYARRIVDSLQSRGYLAGSKGASSVLESTRSAYPAYENIRKNRLEVQLAYLSRLHEASLRSWKAAGFVEQIRIAEELDIIERQIEEIIEKIKSL